ncbi:MAG: hypothetical protein P4L64_09700 [Caulobacteraceae bacterium]|nr:hypothetical protein [Caulobacteraceae bacterium]
MTTITTSPGFDMGRVIQRTFDVLGQNIGPFLIISVLFIALPTELSGLTQTQKGGGLIKFVLFLIQLAASSAGQAAAIWGAVNALDGGKADVQEWIRQGAPHWWRVIAISLLTGIAIALASVLFLAPGLYLLTRMVVAVPAQVSENTGVFVAFSRSADLTKGRRWAVLGLVLLLFVPLTILEFLLIGFANQFHGGLTAAVSSPVTRLVVLPLFVCVTTPISLAGVAALYVELRAGREGPGAGRLAAIFD